MKNITDVTNETFDTEVIQRSATVPVLVDYWADWCGPCQMQMPVLKKLVEDYDGKFVLAKVNTDEQRDLAKAHGIRSLPTMRLYKQGEMVEEILAAQSEATLRTLLDRYVEQASDPLRAKAYALWEQGHHNEALGLLQTTHETDPDNHQLTLDYAEMLMKNDQLEEAAALIAGLPRDIREGKEATRLDALLGFARQAKAAPPIAELEQRIAADPDDLQARQQLGACQVMSGQPGDALETFLQLMQRDRKFQDDAGRRGLLAVFELLENQGDLVNRYRRKLFTLLH